jgi:hypothetical protein
MNDMFIRSTEEVFKHEIHEKPKRNMMNFTLAHHIKNNDENQSMKKRNLFAK